MYVKRLVDSWVYDDLPHRCVYTNIYFMIETWYFRIFDAIVTGIIYYFGYRFYAKHHNKKRFEQMLKSERQIIDFFNKLFKKEKKRKQGPFL